MSYQERLIKEQKFEYQGVFNFAELLELIKDWFDRDRYKYDFKEKLYSESKKAGKKSAKIKWELNRKVDDYHKYIIKVKIDLKNAIENKENIDGKFTIKLDAILEKDYSDVWGSSAWKRFLRAFMDKFIESEKEDKIAKKLILETTSLLNTVKRYFKGK